MFCKNSAVYIHDYVLEVVIRRQFAILFQGVMS